MSNLKDFIGGPSALVAQEAFGEEENYLVVRFEGVTYQTHGVVRRPFKIPADCVGGYARRGNLGQNQTFSFYKNESIDDPVATASFLPAGQISPPATPTGTATIGGVLDPAAETSYTYRVSALDPKGETLASGYRTVDIRVGMRSARLNGFGLSTNGGVVGATSSTITLGASVTDGAGHESDVSKYTFQLPTTINPPDYDPRPLVDSDGGSTLTAGDYEVCGTHVMDGGETTAGPSDQITIASGQALRVKSLTNASYGKVQYEGGDEWFDAFGFKSASRVYFRRVSPTTSSWRYVEFGTGYLDATISSDTAGTAGNPPGSNTASIGGGYLTMDIHTALIGDASQSLIDSPLINIYKGSSLSNMKLLAQHNKTTGQTEYYPSDGSGVDIRTYSGVELRIYDPDVAPSGPYSPDGDTSWDPSPNKAVALAWPATPHATSYNVYRDSQKINDEPVFSPSFVDDGTLNYASGISTPTENTTDSYDATIEGVLATKNNEDIFFEEGDIFYSFCGASTAYRMVVSLPIEFLDE